MRDKKSAMIVTIFSIAFGALLVISSFSDIEMSDEFSNVGMAMILVLLPFLGIAITTLVLATKDKNVKGFIITLLVFWFVILGFFTTALIVPVYGFIVFLVGVGISITPIIYSFKYLSALKQRVVEPTIQPFAGLIYNDGVKQKLDQARQLLDEGYITQEEYELRRKRILEENI